MKWFCSVWRFWVWSGAPLPTGLLDGRLVLLLKGRRIFILVLELDMEVHHWGSVSMLPTVLDHRHGQKHHDAPSGSGQYGLVADWAWVRLTSTYRLEWTFGMSGSNQTIRQVRQRYTNVGRGSRSRLLAVNPGMAFHLNTARRGQG